MTTVFNAGTLVLLLVPIDNTNAFNFVFAVALMLLTAALQAAYKQTDRRFAVDAGPRTALASGDCAPPTAGDLQ
jgi:hypothetical protein